MDSPWIDRVSEPPGYAAVNQRLSSIEHSLSEIRGFLERMVRVEERIVVGTQNMARLEAHLVATDTRIETYKAATDANLARVETAGARNSRFVGGLERLVWITVAIVGAWLGQRM